MGAAQGGCGDFDVIVDSKDNSAYIIYGCNFWMGIEKLTDDYLDSAGGVDGNATIIGGTFGGTTFPEYFVEAPAFFKRGGLFYALFGHCCCFCYQGSGVMVYTAPSPRGPSDTGPGLQLRGAYRDKHSPCATEFCYY